MGKGQRNNEGKNIQNGNKKEGEKGGTKMDEGKKEQQKKITEVVLKAYMHCEGCKSKLSKSLKSLDGVEEVIADVGNEKVVTKGKDLNPMKILEGIRKKYSKNVELISPIQQPDANKHKKAEAKKEEVQVKTVELKMFMHCEGCVKDIKQSIERMKGVMTVEANKESSRVTVKGAIDPPKLVESIKKRIGKNVEMVKKQEKESQAKAEQDKAKKKDAAHGEDEKLVFKYPPQYSLLHIYPDQTFSDDNVFSCSVM